MTSAGTAPDLTAAADVLGRAANRLEEVTAAAIGNFERNADAPWWTPGGLLDAGHDPEDADFIGLVSPAAVAELVPLLRRAAKYALWAIEAGERHHTTFELDGWEADTLTFARRVLRKEADAPAGTVTVEAAGRLVDVPAQPLAHGQREETDGG